MILRAVLIFFAALALGGLGLPFAMWAFSGFPSGDSHGMWIPLIVGVPVGLKYGFILGMMAALGSVCLAGAIGGTASRKIAERTKPPR